MAAMLTLVLGAAVARADPRVDQLLASMTQAEKFSMLNGVGWRGSDLRPGYYVGTTAGVPRLGIPSLKMQDAGQGFRTGGWSPALAARVVGQVTSWSCALGLASSWNASLVGAWARAAAREFRAKGANAVLGPGVNVHRVARGGRNAEYLSGEEPFLGARLAAPYVAGFRAEGVLTVMKHFALNNQETLRDWTNAIVDARTRFEVYYEPFRACVEAGAAAAMCSYNVVNGEHACANAELLERDLKGAMGFRGWVMSDWGAAHSNSAAAGLDQIMPGSCFYNDCSNRTRDESWFADAELARVDGGRIDDMVRRVLAPMVAHGLLDEPSSSCVPGVDCNHTLYETVATSAAHRALALDIAAESALLLKNDGPGAPPLPIRAEPGARVAVVGAACNASHNIAALLAQWDLGNYYVIGGSGRVIPPAVVSVADGVAARAADAGVAVTMSLTDDVASALAAMDGATVAVVCGGATSTEARDRESLALDQEAFIARVASESSTPTVVVALAPGAVLLPFADDVEAIVVLFLAGASTGTAAARVLFGDVNPSAKSPVTFPVSEDDTVAPCPADQTDCPYDEGVLVGYRALEGRAVRFPFGAGESYTTFELALRAPPIMADGALQLSVRVTNTGERAGAEVVQLYVRFPPESAGASPGPLVLKGFAKHLLQPGAAADVSFTVTERELSTWDTRAWDWQRAYGEWEVRVGTSSRDTPITATVTDRAPSSRLEEAEHVAGVVIAVLLTVVAVMYPLGGLILRVVVRARDASANRSFEQLRTDDFGIQMRASGVEGPSRTFVIE